MLIDKDVRVVLSKYLQKEYADFQAAEKLDNFLFAFELGYRSAIDNATEYVFSWHQPMDSMHDSTVKGILREVEQGVRDLNFGDT